MLKSRESDLNLEAWFLDLVYAPSELLTLYIMTVLGILRTGYLAITSNFSDLDLNWCALLTLLFTDMIHIHNSFKMSQADFKPHSTSNEIHMSEENGKCLSAHRHMWENLDVCAFTLTTSHCAPSKWWSIVNMQNCHVHYLISAKLHCAPPKRSSHHFMESYIVNMSKKVGPLCAPGCTMQVSDAQRRLIVHNIALYRWSGAQNSFHKLGYLWNNKINQNHFCLSFA